MWKFLLQYFLKFGSIFGVIKISFNFKTLKAEKSKTKVIFCFCFSTIFIIIFFISSHTVVIFFCDIVGSKEYYVMGLAYMLRICTEMLTYVICVWSLLFRDSLTIIHLINSGSEIIQSLNEKIPISFYMTVLLKIMVLELAFCTFQWCLIWTVYAFPKYVIYSMIITTIGNAINMYSANIFFCAIYLAGKLYEIVNKQLKTIVKPLKKNQKITRAQMLEITGKIEKMMILHGKIGKFVEDLNIFFSLICVAKLLQAFMAITSETYTFFLFFKMLPNFATTILSFYGVLVQIAVVFCFVFAANHVTDQFDKTGDILQIFLDSSIDDRLKNCVSFGTLLTFMLNHYLIMESFRWKYLRCNCLNIELI